MFLKPTHAISSLRPFLKNSTTFLLFGLLALNLFPFSEIVNPALFSLLSAFWIFVLVFVFRFSSSGFLPFDVLNVFCFFIFEKKKIKLFFALVGAA